MMTKSQLPQAPAPDWRQYVMRMVIWVAFVGALGYAAANGGLGFLENDMNLSIEPNRERVSFSGEAPAVIQVKVTLRNNTREPVTLSVASACKIFRWQIFSRAGDLLQSKPLEDVCPAIDTGAVLPSGNALEEFYSIALVGTRYSAGEDYQVRYWYWGYEGEFFFKVE
ncbi:MAG: hypothetical protein ABL996_03565 [Micropepsaceae bacterium]